MDEDTTMDPMTTPVDDTQADENEEMEGGMPAEVGEEEALPELSDDGMGDEDMDVDEEEDDDMDGDF